MTGEPKRGDQMMVGRVGAAVDMIGRCGADEFELAHDEFEEGDEDSVRWWAGANFSGHRVFSQKYPYPAYAVEDLLSRLLNGGTCVNCGRTMVHGIAVESDEFCCALLAALDIDDPTTYVYVRYCEADE